MWIEVRDTGRGMDAALLEQCRDPLHSSKGRRAKGMGLPLVYGAALRHNGRVEVNSTPGEGSSFVLVLQAGVFSPQEKLDTRITRTLGQPNPTDGGRATRGMDRPAPRPSRGSKTRIRDFSTIGQPLDGGAAVQELFTAFSGMDLASIRVLIVDDDPMTRKTLEREVVQLGMPYQVADDGEEALTLIELGHVFDLVVTDVDMPNLRGDEFARLARKYLRESVIVLFTGRPESISQEGSDSANLILLKPPGGAMSFEPVWRRCRRSMLIIN